MAELVVHLAFLVVCEHFFRFLCLFELLLGVRIVAHVRVVLSDGLTVGIFNVVFVGVL